MLKLIKLPLVFFPVTLLLVACASVANPTFGPIKEDSFPDFFLESIAEDQQEVFFYSRAIWYPNKNGFKFLPVGKKSRKGVIVYTDQGIYFSEWSAKKYTTVFNASYDQLEELRLAANDLFGRIVVKKSNYNSFEILGVNGPDLPDKDETEVAYQIIIQQQEQ
ncbi:MAG: hypothetical protein P8X88_01990 [Gammaproteobacteria bacterium]